MAGSDLLTSLMNLSPTGGPAGGVGVAAGDPLQAMNPMSGLPGLPPATIPSATPAPQLTANPTKQVQSLEELLFGG